MTIELEPVRFGGPDREMLGMLSLSRVPGARAALFCNPFGQESIRTAPMYRALADRLAREGCSVLRFDMHGCDDSPGECKDQTLEAWIGDVLTADAFLRERTGRTRLVWFGVALGATIAAIAAVRGPLRPERLLLWAPVVNGEEYIERLRDAHRREFSQGLGMTWALARNRFNFEEPNMPGEVFGYAINATLASELRAIDGLPFDALRAVRTRVTYAAIPSVVISERADDVWLRRISIEEPIDWTTNDARGGALVPQEVQRAVLAALSA